MKGLWLIMFRSMFTNLTWSALENEHGCHWEKLRTKYSLSADNLSKPQSLDDLAVQCIKLCRTMLFERSLPTKKAQRTKIVADMQMPDLLAQHLSQSLVDHLVVTFAHRFYCDNLESGDMEQYLNKIFDLMELFLPPEDDCDAKEVSEKKARREEHKQFFTPSCNKCNSYLRGITGFLEWYKTEKTCNLEGAEGQVLPTYYASMLNREDALLDKYIGGINMFAAPNWLYTLVMANNWKLHPFNIKKKGPIFIRDYRQMNHQDKNLWKGLTTFIGSNPWIFLLLSGQRDSIALPAMEKTFSASSSMQPRKTNTSGLLFVGIPYKEERLFSNPIPAQEYYLKGTKRQCKIPVEIQFMFNSYLLESSFHGYAIAALLEKISNDKIGRDASSFEVLSKCQDVPYVIRCRAPLVHADTIKMLLELKNQISTDDIRSVFDLDWFVDTWNREALPILEELFLWGVYHWFKFEELCVEIEESLMMGGPYRRCDRLNYYRRMISDGQKTRKQKGPEEPSEKISGQNDVIKGLNNLLWGGYCAGIGIRQSRDDYTNILFSPGILTVFDN